MTRRHPAACLLALTLTVLNCAAACPADPDAPPGTALSIRMPGEAPIRWRIAQLDAYPPRAITVRRTPETHGMGAAQGASQASAPAAAPAVEQTVAYAGVLLRDAIAGLTAYTKLGRAQRWLAFEAVATGSDGYRTVFSLGELSPDFGHQPDLVAYAETINGATHDLTSDGFARTTAPADLRGGRYVSNLVSLDVVGSPSKATGTGGGLSSSFSVSGDVLHPGTFNLAALQALTPQTVVAGTNTFVGVSFWDFLNTTVGLAIDPIPKNDVLGMFAVATGSDGYQTTFSLGEIDSLFGNQPDLIAYGVDGGGLGADGFARLVVPNDTKRGRYVSNLVGLEVFHAAAIPEPATWALMLAGLAFVAALARRPLATTRATAITPDSRARRSRP